MKKQLRMYLTQHSNDTFSLTSLEACGVTPHLQSQGGYPNLEVVPSPNLEVTPSPNLEVTPSPNLEVTPPHLQSRGGHPNLEVSTPTPKSRGEHSHTQISR